MKPRAAAVVWIGSKVSFCQRIVEVTAPPRGELGEEFDFNYEIKLPNPSYMQLEPATTCSALHEKYPLVELTPYYLCADSAYGLVAPHVEGKEGFRVYSLEIT